MTDIQGNWRTAQQGRTSPPTSPTSSNTGSFASTAIQDNAAIATTYENGAIHTNTEEAVFSLVRSSLSNTRSFAGSTVKTLDMDALVTGIKETAQEALDKQEGQDTGEKTATTQATENKDVDLEDMSGGDDSRIALYDAATRSLEDAAGNVKENFLPGGDPSKIFDSDCIPCGVRISFSDDLEIQSGLEGFGEQILALLEHQLRQAMKQINQLIDMFTGLNKYVDLCAFLKFMSDFVCVPDLQALLSALIAFASRFNFDVGGLFGLIVRLIGPLLQPFMSNLVNLLQKYLLMVIKPIDCIIDKLQEVLSKIDYSVLFQRYDTMTAGVQWKEGQDYQDYTPTATFDGRKIDVPFTDRTLTSGPLTVRATDSYITSFPLPKTYESPQDYKARKFEANLLGWTGIGAVKAAEQMAVQKAEEELSLLNRASLTIDGSDPQQVEKHKERVAEARAEYENAVRERDLTEIQEVSQNLESFQQGMRSIMNDIMTFIRQAVTEITSFIGSFFEEWKKFMGTYFGGTGNLTLAITQKLQLVQFIGLIRAMIDVFQGEVTCDYREEQELATAVLDRVNPQRIGSTVYLNDDGSVRIDENVGNIEEAIDTVAAALGALDREDDPLVGGEGADARGRRAGKKLKSLINLTGDPALDAEISDTVNKVVMPVSMVFKCPLQTLGSDAEQVNKWIAELDAE